MNVIFIGDVVGKAGRRAVAALLPGLRDEFSADLVVANGENIAGGSGMTASTTQDLFAAGVDILTGGNHTFDKREGEAVLRDDPRVLRPANYPPGTPGASLAVLDLPAGRVAVGGVLGRVFMRPLDDPFRAADELVDRARKAGAQVVLIDAHAEATSEKMALGWHLDGRATLVAGSHTHVPTADARLLPQGTAYITDVGMTGAYDSIIGMQIPSVLRTFRTGRSERFEPARDNPRLCAAVVTCSPESGRAETIVHINRPHEESS